jgi:hypothetical protein
MISNEIGFPIDYNPSHEFLSEVGMSVWDKVRGEFIDIIQWTDDTTDTMVYRFERYNNQIKYGAKLTVREGQAAVFVNEGRIADVFRPGMYTLETENLPILATLKGWKYGFNSPFLAEVYFCSMHQFTDLKWGTMNPIMMRDAEFGPVRIRAFGTYVVHVADSAEGLSLIHGNRRDATIRREAVSVQPVRCESRICSRSKFAEMPVLRLREHHRQICREDRGTRLPLIPSADGR